MPFKFEGAIITFVLHILHTRIFAIRSVVCHRERINSCMSGPTPISANKALSILFIPSFNCFRKSHIHNNKVKRINLIFLTYILVMQHVHDSFKSNQ